MDVLNISIPKPCQENWNEMLPVAGGRHCLQCCKTVTDFTGWEAPAIAAYLESNAGKNICARVTQSQLAGATAPSPKDTLVQTVFRSRMSLVRKIAAAIIILFGMSASSCNTAIMEQVVYFISGESPVDPQIVGELAPIPDSTCVQGAPELTTPSTSL